MQQRGQYVIQYVAVMRAHEHDPSPLLNQIHLPGSEPGSGRHQGYGASSKSSSTSPKQVAVVVATVATEPCDLNVLARFGRNVNAKQVKGVCLHGLMTVCNDTSGVTVVSMMEKYSPLRHHQSNSEKRNGKKEEKKHSIPILNADAKIFF